MARLRSACLVVCISANLAAQSGATPGRLSDRLGVIRPIELHSELEFDAACILAAAANTSLFIMLYRSDCPQSAALEPTWAKAASDLAGDGITFAQADVTRDELVDLTVRLALRPAVSLAGLLLADPGPALCPPMLTLLRGESGGLADTHTALAQHDGRLNDSPPKQPPHPLLAQPLHMHPFLSRTRSHAAFVAFARGGFRSSGTARLALAIAPPRSVTVRALTIVARRLVAAAVGAWRRCAPWLDQLVAPHHATAQWLEQQRLHDRPWWLRSVLPLAALAAVVVATAVGWLLGVLCNAAQDASPLSPRTRSHAAVNAVPNFSGGGQAAAGGWGGRGRCTPRETSSARGNSVAGLSTAAAS